MDLVASLPKPSRVLVVLAHPDDEVLGCWGLMSLLAAAGHALSIRILHHGNQGRSSISAALANELDAHFAVSPDDVFHCAELIESRRLVELIDEWLNELRPTIIISHGVYLGDHQEHRVVGNVITTCWMRYNSRNPLSSARLLRIAPLPHGLGFVPTTFAGIADVFDRKLDALARMDSAMDSRVSRPYLKPDLHKKLAVDLGDRYFAATSSPIEVFEEELRSGMLPLSAPGAPDERHATSLLVTTPLPVARASASPDALKLIAEEYRVCSARADELQRLVWQVFVVIGAITSVLAAAMVRMASGENNPAGPQVVLLVSLIGILFLGIWSKIAKKWSAQMRNYYQRIESLENYLHFRTNSQTKRLDETLTNGKGYTIGDMREALAVILVVGWAILGAFAAYHAAYHLMAEPKTAVEPVGWRSGAFGVSALTFFLMLLVYWLASRSPYKQARND